MSTTTDILFETIGRAGVITLNRPDALNAVTDEMLTALNRHLDLWEADDTVERVVIKAVPGRAFSAGGDIRHLYERGLEKDYDFNFFAREYRLNARIANFPKPYISIVDGIAMGGGVGVSFHGHVIAGENIAFAMPEAGIGFFPDVGASHFLNKAKPEMAMYIALTGNRLKQAECMALGLVGSTCRSDEIAALLDDLCQSADLDGVITKYHSTDDDGDTIEFARDITAVFLQPDVPSIIAEAERRSGDAELSDDQREWVAKVAKTLGQKSPTSLFIAHQQILGGRGLGIDECMRMEFRILKRILVGKDFYEGIRAAIIDKDRAPIWNPADIVDIDVEDIRGHFADLGDEELQLT